MKMKLSFLGKDSVHYDSEIEIPENIGNELKKIIENKNPNDNLFDVSEGDVNNFLKECLPYCTAKLFRTAYGTKLLAEELQKLKISESMGPNEIKMLYNRAALEVSKKLNHQKNVGKNFNQSIEKMDERMKVLKDKLSDLKKDLKELDQEIKNTESKLKLLKLKDKRKKLAIRIEKMKANIDNKKDQKKYKEETKNVAINTAKSSYSSPKIAYSFCKKYNLPITTVYSKSLAEKFNWAEDVEENYFLEYPNND